MNAVALKNGVGHVTRWIDRASGRQPARMVVYYHTIPLAYLAPFERQMDLLLQNAVSKSAADDFDDSPDRNEVAVTFDDGFVSAIDRALPVLRARGIPVTFFIPAGFLGGTPGWALGPDDGAPDERIVSAAWLRELAADPSVTIGSHGLYHRRFTELDEAAARRELRDSKLILEQIVRRPVNTFSFPYGDARPYHVAWAHEAGYSHVYGTRPAPASRKDELLGRVRVDPWDSPGSFVLKISGAYRWASSASEFKRRYLWS